MNLLYKENRFPFLSIIFVISVLVLFFYLAKGIFTLLYWLAPVLLILTAILNHRVIIGFIKDQLKLIKRNPVLGIAAIVLIVLVYPLVCAYLFFKALSNRKLDKIQNEFGKHNESDYADYEIIEEDELDLKQSPEERSKSQRGYDDLFID